MNICKIKGKKKGEKKNPADKAQVARVIYAYATSCYGTRAIPLLRSFFRALRLSYQKGWLTDISFFVGLAPTAPHAGRSRFWLQYLQHRHRNRLQLSSQTRPCWASGYKGQHVP
jgi:hypothetical protein